MFCQACRHPDPDVFITGGGSAYHQSMSCHLLKSGQESVNRRGGMSSPIQTVKLSASGPELEPFLPEWNLRRPIDMKFGADGALYMIEYGDQWWDNTDSRIVRVGYRRGNRAPVARLTASETAGKQPLPLSFDATASHDPDGDGLRFEWSIGGRTQPGGVGARFAHTFDQPGIYEVSVTATDASGAKSSAKETVHVGNGRPAVRFVAPAHGSFFDWGAPIPYKVSVTETDGDRVREELATVQGDFRGRSFAGGDRQELRDPGLALMRASTCFACHMADTPSAGPPYKAVALKYKDDADATESLARKV